MLAKDLFLRNYYFKNDYLLIKLRYKAYILVMVIKSKNEFFQIIYFFKKCLCKQKFWKFPNLPIKYKHKQKTSFKLRKYTFLNYFIQHTKFHMGLWSSLKYCDVTKNGAKTGFSLITHDRHVKNITAQLIHYLGILTHLLRYYTISSYLASFFSSLMLLSNLYLEWIALHCSCGLLYFLFLFYFIYSFILLLIFVCIIIYFFFLSFSFY